MFEANELRTILAKVGNPLKAMILLAANCGFGQTDLASLPTRAVNLDAGWVDFPRPKTAVPRRCPLWPETVAAIREWLPLRPTPKDKADSGLLFVTRFGGRWVELNAKGTPHDAVGKEFTKVLTELNLKRPRLSFYGLRHGFETVAGGSKDQVAVDAIMGHVPQGMSALYRERIEDERLTAVSDFVRNWLFPETTAQPTNTKPTKAADGAAQSPKKAKAPRKQARQRKATDDDVRAERDSRAESEHWPLRLFAG